MRVWKEKKNFVATYRNLLKCMVAGKDHKSAKEICKLELFQKPAETPSRDSNSPPACPVSQEATGIEHMCTLSGNVKLMDHGDLNKIL